LRLRFLFLVGFLFCAALFAGFAVSCQKNYNVSPLNTPVATPTNTPTFNQCTPTAMLTPNPWPNSGPASILSPAYSGIAFVEIQVFDSTYTVQNQQLFSVSSGSPLLIDSHDLHGVTYPPGNYYLQVGVTVLGAGGVSECYFQPITIN